MNAEYVILQIKVWLHTMDSAKGFNSPHPL
jgi:hypothetical protein